MSDIIDNSLSGTILKTMDSGDLNKQVKKLLDETPFMSVPAGYCGEIENLSSNVYSKVQDRLNVKIEDYVPNLDDLETMTISVIGMVPAVGPMMQGLFTLMSNKVKGSQRKEVITKDTIKNMVDIEIGKVKKELIQTIKDKIEKSSIEQKVKICEKGFEGVQEAHLDLLYDSLTHLKLRLLKKQIPEKNDALLIGIRSKFDSLRTNTKILLSLATDQAILSYSPNLSIQIMGLYILVLNDLIYHWHQYGFDPEYALGTPADDEEPATHSYREKLHINIQKFLKEVSIATTNLNKAIDEIVELDQNDDLFEDEEVTDYRTKKESDVENNNITQMNNCDKVFESDPFYYPVPLIKVSKEGSSDCVKISTSQKKGPCIYRIDGKEFASLFPSGPIITPMFDPESKSSDLATKCYGMYVRTPVKVNIELDEAKKIHVRCLYFYQKTETGVKIQVGDEAKNTSKTYNDVYCGTTPDDLVRSLDVSNSQWGFFVSDEFKKNDKFTLTLQFGLSFAKLVFCELIVTD